MNRRQHTDETNFLLLTALALGCELAACGSLETQSSPEQTQPIQEENQVQNGTSPSVQSTPFSSTSPDAVESIGNGETYALMAYFSATGNTEGIPRHIQTVLNAGLYEIIPEVPTPVKT